LAPVRQQSMPREDGRRRIATTNSFSPGLPKRRPSNSSNVASFMRTRSQMNLSEVLAAEDGAPDPDDPMLFQRRSKAAYDEGGAAATGEDLGRLLSDERRLSEILRGPSGLQARSMRLIGKSNPRYRWEKYWKHDGELRTMKKSMYVCVLCVGK
jgi:hypothetical protein